MGFWVKTSDETWLNTALALYQKRISISIKDDANYKLSENSDVIKTFKRVTLPINSVLILFTFYLLAIVCFIFLYLSFSLEYAKTIGIVISSILSIICLTIPSYYFSKNKPPKIKKTKHGIDIKFNDGIDINLTL